MTSQYKPSDLDDYYSSLFQAGAVPALPTAANLKTVRTAVAGALSDVKAYELAEERVRFGLAPQQENEDPWASKFRYVDRKLKDLSLDQLIVLGHRVQEEYPTAELEHVLKLAGAGGVAGALKNLIFAAFGPKPKIVLRDAVNNDIEISENGQNCLVYDRALPPEGLSWRALVSWWAKEETVPAAAERAEATALYRRLLASLGDNEAEKFLFDQYCTLYRMYGFDLPALIPQVYLHYDPYTKGTGATLTRQRMDFLLLLPNRRRIVIELDGVQHYALNGHPRPDLYAAMVAEDRKLRLAGYEVYRFGGQEFVDRRAAAGMLLGFFQELLQLPTAQTRSAG
ncbi:hypothetical protein GCM10027405_03280 [Arthrobacter alkaliphilus]|uniref:hypothetical protein n=1 Tax=Arthrobacter alkaliphilus TaxID=369936 RepID=UPI001F4418A6|nr:hypothetical protein [Arthrobacter alkaliphilus]